MEILIRQTLFFFTFCILFTTNVRCQETVFDEQRRNIVFVNLGMAGFFDINLVYNRILTPAAILRQGYSLSAGFWQEGGIFFMNGGGPCYDANYTVQMHSNKKKHVFYELNLGVKYISSRDFIQKYEKAINPSIVYADSRYRYGFLPNILFARVHQRQGMYLRAGIGFPAFISFAVGFRTE